MISIRRAYTIVFGGLFIGVVVIMVMFTFKRGAVHAQRHPSKSTEKLTVEIATSGAALVQTNPVPINGSLGTVMVKLTPEGARSSVERKVVVVLQEGIKIGDQVHLDWFSVGNAITGTQLVSATKTAKTAGGH